MFALPWHKYVILLILLLGFGIFLWGPIRYVAVVISSHKEVHMRRGEILHIVDGSSRARAEQARIGFALGSHCEVYGDIEEMMIRPPERGVVIIKDEPGQSRARRVLEELANHGQWLPVVVLGSDPRPCDIVDAIQVGAVDYLPLPLTEERLDSALTKVAAEVEAHGEACQRVVEARRRISTLTNREREVLDWLAKGRSNKMIARELGISPRTVEIHRANMMSKIGAEHSAEAVRLRIEAQISSSDDNERDEDTNLHLAPPRRAMVPPNSDQPVFQQIAEKRASGKDLAIPANATPAHIGSSTIGTSAAPV
jgi:FixJ family two-component response regulator